MGHVVNGVHIDGQALFAGRMGQSIPKTCYFVVRRRFGRMEHLLRTLDLLDSLLVQLLLVVVVASLCSVIAFLNACLVTKLIAQLFTNLIGGLIGGG